MNRILYFTMMVLGLVACSTDSLTDKEYHIETSDGVILYAHVRGRGEPCLYLHGGPGSGSTWMKEMGGKELEKRFTMVYLDQRGVCRSSEPSDDNFSLSRQTLDFEEVREALGFKKWHLLGHSFGGILEIAYWRDCHESISGMIFEDCTLSMSDSFKDSWLPAAIEIIGEDADPVAKDTTADLKEQFPNAIVKIGDCGHFPFLESPEEWSAALDEYLVNN